MLFVEVELLEKEWRGAVIFESFDRERRIAASDLKAASPTRRHGECGPSAIPRPKLSQLYFLPFLILFLVLCCVHEARTK